MQDNKKPGDTQRPVDKGGQQQRMPGAHPDHPRNKPSGGRRNQEPLKSALKFAGGLDGHRRDFTPASREHHFV